MVHEGTWKLISTALLGKGVHLRTPISSRRRGPSPHYWLVVGCGVAMQEGRWEGLMCVW